MSLAKDLLIQFIFSMKQLLVSFFFAIVFFVSISFMSALILTIFFLLLALGFVCSSFSSCFMGKVQYSLVQLLSHVWLFATPWTPACQITCPSLELTQTPIHRVDIAIQPSHPLLSPSPLTFNLSSIRVFSNESVLHIKWPTSWSFSFSISPSNKYSGMISIRMDWLNLLTVQGTIRSVLQHHSSKASILWCSVFFIVQLSHQPWLDRPLLEK